MKSDRMNVNNEDIWFKYDYSTKKFTKLIFYKSQFDVDIKAEIPNNIETSFNFVLDYINKTNPSLDEIKNLILYMIEKGKDTLQLNTSQNIHQRDSFNEPITLRRIAYEHVKRYVEENKSANLDNITSEIIESRKYNIKSSKDSIRASVSSVLSALRNAFKDEGVESWNESIWRGNTTGRNPHIKVPDNFSMPNYSTLWERYKEYLNKEKQMR